MRRRVAGATHGSLGRRWWYAATPSALAIAVVLLLVVLSGGGDDGVVARNDAGASPAVPPAGSELGVGDVAALDDGAVARLNSVLDDVDLAPGLPAPEPGMRLVRLDVELCAGNARFIVDPAFWLGIGEENAIYSAHLGVYDLIALTMAPGTCQRGDVDLAVPEGAELQEVLLMDQETTTTARWSLADRPRALEPLSSEVDPDVAAAGAPVPLATGGTVTLHAAKPPADRAADKAGRRSETVPFRIEGEVCAGERELPAARKSWLVQLPNHRVIAPDQEVTTTGARTLEPGACERVRVGFSLPPSGQAVAVIYASGGITGEARWNVR